MPLPENEVKTHDKIKADAIRDFVCMMIGALESGFVERNHCTLAEIHQVARNHIKDSFGIETPSIVDEWGEGVADLCGLSKKHKRPTHQRPK